MEKIKILNAYSSLGGNRYKWDEVAKEANVEIEVTAIELDEELAKLYQERFPNDKVIITDAHKFIKERYSEFSIIWTSPGCPSHSKARYWAFGANGKMPIYPDMKLYEEIIFLQYHFKGKYCVENVIPYYEPMLNPKKRDRHLYWTNFNLPNKLSDRHFKGLSSAENEVNKLCEFHDFDFRRYKGTQRLNKIARNLVDYEAGRTILETALGITKQRNVKQTELF